MTQRSAIYLDSNAGAPLHPRVIEALTPLLLPLSRAGSPPLISNPSSIHQHGRQSKRHLAEAREHVAATLGTKVDPEQLIFTSSGTEANQSVIRAVLEDRLQGGGPVTWITTPVEHDSTLQMQAWAKKRGVQVIDLDIDAFGRPVLDSLDRHWNDSVALVSLVWVNNETGVITDIPAWSERIRGRGAKLHVDGAQAWGKIPIQIDQLSIDALTLSAHKIGALAGTGAIWISRGFPFHPLVEGKQEKGRRGGTENLLGIAAMGAAASALNPEETREYLEPLRDLLESQIESKISGVIWNGRGAARVPNTSNFCFEGVEGDGIVMAMDLAGFSVSSGSACSSGVLEPSHVLMAMGRTKELARSATRVSLHSGITSDMIDQFVEALAGVVERIRRARRNEEETRSHE